MAMSIKNNFTVYELGSPTVRLNSQLAEGYPIYIWLDEHNTAIYSRNLKQLLQNPRVPKLTVNYNALSKLLQYGVICPPKTLYKNLFVLGIGDRAKISTENGRIKLQINHDFPFSNNTRPSNEHVEFSNIFLLENLAQHYLQREDKSKKTCFFYSAGKDSNAILLALSKANLQNQVDLVTYQSTKSFDESNIAASIAKKLGFRHHTLKLDVPTTGAFPIALYHGYFSSICLPCVDTASLAYPLFSLAYDFRDSNIIDGSGNDVYIGHIPSKFEYLRQKYLSKTHFIQKILPKLSSTGYLKATTISKAECSGMFGFSDQDLVKFCNFDITPKNTKIWDQKLHCHPDYLDFRADIWGCAIEYERVIGKTKNFADWQNSNLILPWTDTKIAEYIRKLPEQVLFDRKNLINKLPLRTLLKEELNLDSDKLGKMGYGFDAMLFLQKAKKYIITEILDCQLWNENIENQLMKLIKTAEQGKKYSHRRACLLTLQLFIISGWYNHCQYLECSNKK